MNISSKNFEINAEIISKLIIDGKKVVDSYGSSLEAKIREFKNQRNKRDKELYSFIV